MLDHMFLNFTHLCSIDLLDIQKLYPLRLIFGKRFLYTGICYKYIGLAVLSAMLRSNTCERI